MFDRFETGYKTTIGVDVSTHEVTITQGPIKLILWGADGDFGASIIETVYLRGAWAAVIVADATRPVAPGCARERPSRDIEGPHEAW